MSAIEVGDDTAKLFEELKAASAARLKWSKYEDDLKKKLLTTLGYDPDDDKPQSLSAVDAAGAPLFEVEVTYRKGFSKTRLATHYPAAYADCEQLTPVKTIRPVKTV